MAILDFWDWVDQEIEERGLSYHQIEKETGLANAALYKPARNRTGPTLRICKALAQAFHMPTETVLRLAGHLPRMPAPVEQEKELVDLFRRLPPGVRPVILAALRGAAGVGVTRPSPDIPPAADEPLPESELPSLETEEVRWSELHRAVGRLDGERLNDLADYVLYVRWLRDRDRERGALPEQREAVPREERAE